MSRIRSIHPGQWRDADFVECSFAARLLAVALRNDADDQGIFEWRPKQIKINCFPADDVNIDDLLGELITFNIVKSFDHAGKKFGAIRNFRRYQRPKKPNHIHFLPPELVTFVGHQEDGGEPVGNRFGAGSEPEIDQGEPGSEIPSQKKEVGEGVGSRKEGKKEPHAESVVPLPRARRTRADSGLAFEGSVVRLTQKDFDNWRRSYAGVPDLRAELQTIDAKLVDEGHQGNWFGMVSAWLRAKHEKAIKAGERANGQGFGAPGFA
jgi:hypothetical protein